MVMICSACSGKPSPTPFFHPPSCCSHTHAYACTHTHVHTHTHTLSASSFLPPYPQLCLWVKHQPGIFFPIVSTSPSSALPQLLLLPEKCRIVTPVVNKNMTLISCLLSLQVPGHILHANEGPKVRTWKI